MKKRVTSGWVLSFSSEEALLQAVRTLVKEEGVFWEVCAPYPCAAVRLASRHAGRAVGAGVRLWAAAGGVCGFLGVALWLYWTQFCADREDRAAALAAALHPDASEYIHEEGGRS